MASTPSNLVKAQYSKRSNAVWVRVDEDIIHVGGYDNVRERKSCAHDRDWYDELGLTPKQDLYTKYVDPAVTVETGEPRMVIDKLLETVPRCVVKGREGVERWISQSGPSRISNVPFICAQCEKKTFGVLQKDLRAIGVPPRRIAAVCAKYEGSVNKYCLFPKVRVPSGGTDLLVPIDLLPDIFNMFDTSDDSDTARRLNQSASHFVQQIYRIISKHTIRLNIGGLGNARIAAITEKINTIADIRAVAFTHFAEKIDSMERRSEVARERERAKDVALTTQSEHIALLMRSLRGMRAQLAALMDTVANNSSAIAIMGGLADPKFVAPLPGVSVQTAARFHPDRTEKMPKEEWLATFKSIANLVGSDAPTAADIDAVYLDLVTRARTEMGVPTPSPVWHNAFTLFRQQTGLENPTFEEMLEEFERFAEKSQHSSRKRQKSLDVGS